jgi:serine/threonine protein kinase
MRGLASTRAWAPSEEAAGGTRWGSSSRYVIHREVGFGGMGIVYAATDTLLGRLVALKVLHQSEPNDTQQPSRILTEARLAAQVEHERIARIYDVDEHDGKLFVAMEFVRGVTLRARMNAVALDATDIVTIAVQIAEGLAALHAHRLIHRDLKPENVMLSESGAVKLLDFGLAREIAGAVFPGEPPPSERSPSENLMSPSGTPGYMAPERFDGRALDYRVDVFALGVIVYELVVGIRPLGDGAPFSTQRAKLGWPDFSGRRWSRMGHLKEVTARMLARDPAKRLADGTQALAALRQVAFRASGVYARTPPAALGPTATDDPFDARSSLVPTLPRTETGGRPRLRAFFSSHASRLALLALAIFATATAERGRGSPPAMMSPSSAPSKDAPEMDRPRDEGAPPAGSHFALPAASADPRPSTSPTDSPPATRLEIPLRRHPRSRKRAILLGTNGSPIFP